MILDLSRLENVRPCVEGWQSRCIGCAFEGRDAHGKNHLRIYRNGKFHCAANSTKEHNRLIIQLAGKDSDGTVEYYHEIPTPKEPEYYDDKILVNLVKDYTYWNNRGVPNDVMEQSVFPLRDINNRIIGFAGRYIHEIKPKSYIVKWKQIGRKSLAIFPRNAESYIKEKKEVILTESIGCVLGTCSVGIKNNLCLLGTNISDSIIGFLISLNVKKIIIATNNEPDNKNIGNEAAEEIYYKLIKIFNPEYVEIRLPPKKDFLECVREPKLILDWYKNEKQTTSIQKGN